MKYPDYHGKTLCIIGAGFLQIPAIQRAGEMGLVTVVIDYNPSAPGIKYADDFICASTFDAEACVKGIADFQKAAQRKINAVMTIGTDASYTVAKVAEAFHLHGISPKTALRASDKYLMRQTLEKAGVPVPRFVQVSDFNDALEAFYQLGEDCVIKPVRNMGARGVRRVNVLGDLKEAFELAMSYSKTGRVLLEQRIKGPELSIDALVWNHELILTGVADRIIEYDPYFVETGHIMPSRLKSGWIENAINVFKEGVVALGIDNWAAKGDIKTGPEGAFVGEIAARLSGGFMSTHTFPLSSGVDLVGNMISVAMGDGPYDCRPKFSRCAIERALILPPGKLVRSIGDDERPYLQGVERVLISARQGDVIEDPQNNLDKSGHVIVYAEDFRGANRLVNKVMDQLREKMIVEAYENGKNFKTVIWSRFFIDFNQKQRWLYCKTAYQKGFYLIIEGLLREDFEQCLLWNFGKVMPLLPADVEEKELVFYLNLGLNWIAVRESDFEKSERIGIFRCEDSCESIDLSKADYVVDVQGKFEYFSQKDFDKTGFFSQILIEDSSTLLNPE